MFCQLSNLQHTELSIRLDTLSTLDQNILDDVLISSRSRITYIKLYWGSKTIIANIYLATAIGDWSPSSVLDLLEWLLTITLAYS